METQPCLTLCLSVSYTCVNIYHIVIMVLLWKCEYGHVGATGCFQWTLVDQNQVYTHIMINLHL